MSHAALEGHPKYVEQMAVVAEVEARADNIRAQALEHQRQVDQAARDQEAAIAEAVATGGVIPATPPAPAANDNLQTAEYWIRHEQAAAAAETTRVIGAISVEVEAGLRKAVAAEMTAVKAAAEKVEGARLRVEDALSTAHRVRRAVEAGAAEITRPSRADRTRSSVPTADLLDMARAGHDPLAPLPIPPREGAIQQAGLQDEGRTPSMAGHYAATLAALPAEAQERLRRERDAPVRW